MTATILPFPTRRPQDPLTIVSESLARALNEARNPAHAACIGAITRMRDRHAVGSAPHATLSSCADDIKAACVRTESLVVQARVLEHALPALDGTRALGIARSFADMADTMAQALRTTTSEMQLLLDSLESTPSAP